MLKMTTKARRSSSRTKSCAAFACWRLSLRSEGLSFSCPDFAVGNRFCPACYSPRFRASPHRRPEPLLSPESGVIFFIGCPQIGNARSLLVLAQRLFVLELQLPLRFVFFQKLA